MEEKAVKRGRLRKRKRRFSLSEPCGGRGEIIVEKRKKREEKKKKLVKERKVLRVKVAVSGSFTWTQIIVEGENFKGRSEKHEERKVASVKVAG